MDHGSASGIRLASARALTRGLRAAPSPASGRGDKLRAAPRHLLPFSLPRAVCGGGPGRGAPASRRPILSSSRDPSATTPPPQFGGGVASRREERAKGLAGERAPRGASPMPAGPAPTPARAAPWTPATSPRPPRSPPSAGGWRTRRSSTSSDAAASIVPPRRADDEGAERRPHRADALRRHAVLRRQRQHVVHVASAQLTTTRPCASPKSSALAGSASSSSTSIPNGAVAERALRQRHGQPALRRVVRGADQAGADHRQQRRLQRRLAVQARWRGRRRPRGRGSTLRYSLPPSSAVLRAQQDDGVARAP